MYIIDLLLKNIDKVTGKAKIQAADADIAALGALADLAKTDPAQAASVISSLKGILKQLQGSGTGALPTQLTGSIPEYAWLAGGSEAVPDDLTKFAWGYKFNATTGVVTAYGWSGSAWVEVV